jgi:hypothetical protein
MKPWDVLSPIFIQQNQTLKIRETERSEVMIFSPQ